jgi:hypothetical protein
VVPFLPVWDEQRKYAILFRLTDAEVEVEFVINTNGTVWGDSKSPRYLQMYLQMLQFRLIDAIENAKRMPRKD